MLDYVTQLEASNAELKKYVSLASHELRNPLSIIDMKAQRLYRRVGQLNHEEIRESATKTRGAVKRIFDLIDGMLNSAKAEAGKLQSNFQEVNIQDIIGECCNTQMDMTPDYNIEINLEELPDSISADPSHLNQIMTNLLSNAVKYSPDNKTIIVKGWKENDQAVFSVTDHGLGIPETEMPKLFERFFRTSLTTGISGTGIGLNLVKQLIENHGGQISVSSNEGKGTTFTIMLPINILQVPE